MNKLVIYIHGKGGSAKEALFYRPLFPGYDVIGLDYGSETPWDAKEEFPLFFDKAAENRDEIILIANSIGACFALYALSDKNIKRAFFISPIVDMAKLISDMMVWANVTEEELREKGVIKTSFGEPLSWEYLSYVRENPIEWNAPTDILYGSRDGLTSFETVSAFAKKINAGLCVMDGGEHWFHTEEQTEFLKKWISSLLNGGK